MEEQTKIIRHIRKELQKLTLCGETIEFNKMPNLHPMTKDFNKNMAFIERNYKKDICPVCLKNYIRLEIDRQIEKEKNGKVVN